MTPNIENNPLNTGNGAPQGSNPITPVTAQAAPTPKPAATPVAPAPVSPTASTPATPTRQQVAAATTAQTSAENIVSGTSKILQFKKYIIAGIVGIIFLTIIYVAYGFFSSPSDEVETESPTTEVELNNSLSGSDSTDSTDSTNSADQAELEKVVNDLKDQYKDENPNPPGINIVIPETTETDTSTPADTDTTPPADSESDTTPPADSGSSTTPPADSGSDTTPPADSGSNTTPPADSEEVSR